MTELNFRIITPGQIPLGKIVDVVLLVSHTSLQDLEHIRGRLKYSSSLSLLGLDRINIPKIPAGEEISIPLRVSSRQPGRIQISFKNLNAITAGGVDLDFKDCELEIEISHQLEIHESDVSLTLESLSSIRQYMIGQIRCRLHNNSKFMVSHLNIIISAEGCEVYMPGALATENLAPGATVEFEVQVLPGIAGEIVAKLELRFSIMQQDFSYTMKRIFSVIPSAQHTGSRWKGPLYTILLISSSPTDEAVIRTDKEFRNILFEMKHSAPERDRFHVEVLPAATIDDLSREITYLHPYLMHFSGHGTNQGILLEDDDETGSLLSADALLGLLQPVSDQVRCVILNACYSLRSARKLAECVQYVIGMRTAILDSAAIAFSRGFYEAIGAGYPIETAFDLGKARLINGHFDESLTPVLFKNS